MTKFFEEGISTKSNSVYLKVTNVKIKFTNLDKDWLNHVIFIMHKRYSKFENICYRAKKKKKE